MPELRFHKLIQRDLNKVLEFYTSEGGPKLADRFFEEAESVVERIRKNPTHFHFTTENYRRADLKRFPYHFLFEERLDHWKILILRHHRRHPKHGLKRR